jgi:hypothetical protein
MEQKILGELVGDHGSLGRVAGIKYLDQMHQSI